MADEDVCIFLSYAHDDDLTLSSSEDEVGFVTFLDKMLELKLRDLGATRAKIWIDRKRVSDGDLFDGAIDEGLYKAKLMLVIMSPNWMQRPYCRKELDAFCDLRKKAGVSSVQERMIVVGKGYVDRLKRPFELQGQEGFLFYARDDTNNVSDATPFFNRGKASEKFYDVRDKLAVFLQKRVDRIAEGGALGATLAQSQPIVSPNGRVVYLAKPASDMKAAYARVATELQGKGFTVVPGAAADLPSDSSALTAVKDALRRGRGLRPYRGGEAGICAGRPRSHREAPTRARAGEGCRQHWPDGMRLPPHRLGPEGSRPGRTRTSVYRGTRSAPGP